MSRPDFGQLVTALAEAVAPFVRAGSAIELARNVAQTLWSNRDTGYSAHPVDVVADAIEHRCAHGWLEVTDVTACADAMAGAWAPWLARQTRLARPLETAIAVGHPLTVIRTHGLFEAQCARCSGAGLSLQAALAALESEMEADQ
jgi:hypothetical protein